MRASRLLWVPVVLCAGGVGCALDRSGQTGDAASGSAATTSGTGGAVGASSATATGSGGSGMATGSGGEGATGAASTGGGGRGGGGAGGMAGGGGAGGIGEPVGDATAPCGSGITIDGVLGEPAWNGPWSSVTKKVQGNDLGVTAVMRARWDDQYLYVGVEVVDGSLHNDSANAWEDDSVEVYLDMNHDKSTTYQADDFQYIAGQGDTSIWEKGNKTAGTSMATSAIAMGYAVELRVPWTTLGNSPAAGNVYGFDIGVNVDDDGGPRDEQLMWFGTSNNYTDTSQFGDLTLGAACP